MKNKCLLLSLILFVQVACAQRNCTSFEHLQEMLSTDLEFVSNREFIEKQTSDFVNNPSLKSRAVITIPVVFHVVYNTSVQNISDAQIQSQLVGLNADFRRLHSSIS